MKLSLASAQKDAAIEEVARLLDGHPGVTDFQGFYRDLLAREALDTTYLGYDVATPHGRTTHVDRIVIAVGRSEAGIPYSNSGGKARLIFVLGTPKSAPRAYLDLIGSLCRLLHNPENRAAFLNAPTPGAFIEAVAAAEEKVLKT